MTIWLNGHLRENGTVDATSAGHTLGWGVFTTMGIRNGTPLFLQHHFERLSRDAHATAIPFDLSLEEIASGLHQVIAANKVRNGLARLTLTQRGDGRWNMDNGADLSIMAQELAPSHSQLRVQLSPYRVEAKRPLVGIKTTSYLPYQWAWREGKANGFDEVILRDGREFLSEGARSSLFWVQKGELYLPSLETGCLRGIGRDLLTQWVASSGIIVHEGQFSASAALDAIETGLISVATGPRFITSWHDEAGTLLREWNAAGEVGTALQDWWETASQ